MMIQQEEIGGKSKRNSRFRQRGFTLVELLVVMAISAILLGLIFGPVVTAFNLTSRARTQIEGQASAREVMSQVTRLLTNAVFIYDNADPGSNINLWFTTDNSGNKGTPTAIATRFAMIEYVTPSRQQDQTPGSIPIDPTSGDPMYSKVNGQSGYAIPLAPGRAIGRIWIGLQNNATAGGGAFNGVPKFPYANRFEDPANGADNRYALYRAEVVAYVPDTTNFLPDPNNPNVKYVPDLRLFHTLADSGGTVDKKDGALVLHDPNFFYDNSLAGGNEANAGSPAAWAVPGWKDLNGDGKVEIAENWRALASTMMPVDKSDLVTLTRDDNNQVVYTDVNGVKNGQSGYDVQTGKPEAHPLVTFSPTFLQNDPGVPTSLESTANEAPNPAPATYTSQYSHWATPYRVIVYRNPNLTGPTSNADPLSLPTLEYFMATGDGKIGHVTGANPGDTPPAMSTLPDVGPGPQVTTTGVFSAPDPAIAFTADPTRGVVNFAFPSSTYIHDVNNNPLPCRYDPAAVNAGMTGPYERRYIDLRLPLAGPLNPGTTVSPLNQPQTKNIVQIVPGSERVYGPDQRPGPNYGYRILYSRVSANAGTIGPNEYKINYANIRNGGLADTNDAINGNDPRVHVGYIEFNSIWDSASGPNTNGGPNSLPTQKVDTGNVVAADPVEVTYSFQMNRSSDVIKIDYLTRTLVNVAIQARFYDPPTGAPQTISLTNKVKIGNLKR